MSMLFQLDNIILLHDARSGKLAIQMAINVAEFVAGATHEIYEVFVSR
jgi:hypothetical protein